MESDEEGGNDEQLDRSELPADVPGELEIHRHSCDEDEDEPPPRKRQKRDTATSVPKWTKGDRVALASKPSEPPKVGEEHITKDEFEVFRLFLTDDMIEELVVQTILYAQRDKNNPSFTVTLEEMRQFLGLLLISGYHSLPGENDYWSTAEDFTSPVFAQTMARDKFRGIKRYLHLADNQKLSSSKVAKVAPFYLSLVRQFQQFGVYHTHLSIDEEMVPYHGHHSAKMFIRNKPIRFGFKLWMLCSHDGYPYNLQIYCGKDGDDKSPLGTRVVMQLLDCVSEPSNHVVYFDNFFTSYQLLTDLALKGVRAIGTVRENRTNHCPLISTANMKKQERGSYDYRSDGQVTCVRWNDNSVVTLASNHTAVKPLQTARRRVKAMKAKEVPQPHVVHKYNKGMGGVDVLDRMLAAYRPQLRSRKWWWNLFANALNMAVVAAFRFYKYLHPQEAHVTHLLFRRTVSMALLKAQPARLRSGGPTAPTPFPIRYDGVNHFLESCTQGRCILCQRNTRLRCSKCGKRLHKLCSTFYHTK